MKIIYCITHIPSGKKYVGQFNREGGWDRYWGSGILIKKAILKYGRNEFKKEILCECLNLEDLNKMEIFWIRELDCFTPNGYNIREGGDGTDVRSHKTPEELDAWVEKIRAVWNDPNKKGKAAQITREYHANLTPEQKKARSDKIRLTKSLQTVEEKKKYAKKNVESRRQGKGYSISEEGKNSIRKANKNREVSEETRAKMSRSAKEKEVSEETRAKMSKSAKGKRRSEEHCRNISAVKKGRVWITDGVVSKQIFFDNTEQLPEGWIFGRASYKK